MEQQSTTLISVGALPLILLMGLYKLRKFIFEVFDQIGCIKMLGLRNVGANYRQH